MLRLNLLRTPATMKNAQFLMLFAAALLGGGLFSASSLAPEKTPTPAATQFFETKVRPVLLVHCFECHAGKKHKGGLQLDSLAAMLEGGDQGPAMVPGHPEKSLLIKAILQDGMLKMPKAKKLPRAEIEALTQWIKM